MPVGNAPDVIERQPIEDHILCRMGAEEIGSVRAADDVRVREPDALGNPRAPRCQAEECRFVRAALENVRRGGSRHQFGNISAFEPCRRRRTTTASEPTQSRRNCK